MQCDKKFEVFALRMSCRENRGVINWNVIFKKSPRKYISPQLPFGKKNLASLII